MSIAVRTVEQELQAEESALTSIGARSRKSKGRKSSESTSADCKTTYQHDKDRIIHSQAFRRLQHKTQVFLYHEGDFYRTRLTHSLEVAEIGRTVARLLGANQDLTDAICLAHDIGHPPFGHAGEKVLSEMMESNGGFDHNIQALRVVDELEAGPTESAGLNLTWESREGIARHTTPFDAPPSHPEFNTPQAGIEAQIANVADTVAYAAHDLEDAIVARLLDRGDIEGQGLWRRAIRILGTPDYSSLQREIRTIARTIADILIRDVVSQTVSNLQKSQIDSPEEVRLVANALVDFSEELRAEVKNFVNALIDHVYREPRVGRMDTNARNMLRTLSRQFLANTKLLPTVTQRKLGANSAHRVVCDYLSGMTDRHAIELYKSMFDPDGRSLILFS